MAPFQCSSSSSSSTLLPADGSATLIPGLPNDAAAHILSFVPYSHHPRIKPTSKSWYAFLSSKTLISIRHHLSHLSHLLCIFPQDPSISSPYLFDPHNMAWRPLPLMPCNPNAYWLCNFTAVSIGPNLYLLGGSLFDHRSFPIDRPSPSSSAFRFNFVDWSWEQLSPMLSPRGSFACAAIPQLGQIIVAGGGSRHTLFGAAGSRMSSVERYDVERDEWVAMEGLPRYRAGSVGFLVGDGEDREFWVMGGYGESRTISGVCPVDEYYRDAVAMDLSRKGAGKWRQVGDMWQEGRGRARLGKIVVVEDYGCHSPGIFMLDRNDIFRYNMALNSLEKESTVPKKAPSDSSCGFVALDGELYIMILLTGVDATEKRRLRHHKRAGTLLIQIYNPTKKTWRSLVTKLPSNMRLDFNTAVMCTVQL